MANLYVNKNPEQFTIPGTESPFQKLGSSLFSAIGNNLSNQQPKTLGGVVMPSQGLNIPQQYVPQPIAKQPVVQPKVNTTPTYTAPVINNSNPDQRDGNGLLINPPGALFDRNTGNPITTTPTPAVPGSVASIVSPDTGYNYVGQDGNIYNSVTGAVQGQQGESALPTEAENYANTLKQYQSDIDAINNMYNDTLNQSRVKNAPEYAAREAQNRLQQIQGGIASSPMGSAQTAGVQSANREEQAVAEQVINIQRQNAINSIKGEIRQMSTKDLEAKKAAKAKSADEYVKYLNEAPERKAKNISAAVKKALSLGLALEDIDPKDIEALGGLEDVKAEYNSQKANAEAEQAKADLETKKTEADIAQTTAETGQIGKVSPSVLAQIASSEKIAAGKVAEKDKVTYDSKTIPNTVKSELIADLQSNLNAKRKEQKSLNDFIAAYPEVDSTYLTKLFEASK